MDLSRENQKLLRNPEPNISNAIESINNNLSKTLYRIEKENENKKINLKYRNSAYHEIIDEIYYISKRHNDKTYSLLILLSFYKEDFPWLYDMGRDLIELLKSKGSVEKKREGTINFKESLDITLKSPAVRELFSRRKDSAFLSNDIFFIINKHLEELALTL